VITQLQERSESERERKRKDRDGRNLIARASSFGFARQYLFISCSKIQCSMANFCVNCGRKLGFRDKFTYTDKLCNKCTIALDNKRRAEAAELENKRRAEAAELERARKAVENERNALLARVEWIIKETTPHTAVD